MGDRQAGLPKEARLHKPHEFARVFAQGQAFVSAGLVAIAAPSARPFARLGTALAKRRLRRAVDRNRIKRVLRESFRHAHSGLGGVDIVVLARHRCAALSNAELFAQLAGLWSQAAALARSTPPTADDGRQR